MAWHKTVTCFTLPLFNIIKKEVLFSYRCRILLKAAVRFDRLLNRASSGLTINLSIASDVELCSRYEKMYQYQYPGSPDIRACSHVFFL